MSVRSWVAGRVGRVELDRPQALNALDLGMVRSLQRVLDGWRDDGAVECVVLTGAGRAFCAGGDVRSAREAVLAGRPHDAATYFAEEYALDGTVAEYPKPYVAVIDGAAMGGGLGVSAHGTARVVTERAVLAMPETAIGFATDVGMKHAFSHLDGDAGGAVGRYLALTGARVGAADALAMGLATHHVASRDLAGLLDDLARDGVAALDGRTTAPEEPATLAGAVRDAVEECFGAGSVTEILARLDALGGREGPAGTWAAETAAVLRAACPTSLVVVLELLAAGRTSTVAECLERETRVAPWLAARADFAEGVRAVLVDKDRSPRWSPDRLEDVDVDAVRALL